MSELTICPGDNLATLHHLAATGERFDLIELDGPYGAGLEGWDILTEDEYLAHYTARLPLVRDLLQPWGVVFVFGYPEGCAEIKAWARASGTLRLRRWLTWYKQRTAHKGRKCETILMLLRDTPEVARRNFGEMLRAARLHRGWSLMDLSQAAVAQGHPQWWHRGGNLYFETGSGGQPSVQDYVVLSDLLGFDAEEWSAVIGPAYDGITDLDYIGTSYPEPTATLNEAGLRSKPIGLYTDLFAPVMPPRPVKRALILYGGSGNAAYAAGKLGYDVTVCEMDPARCARIGRRWAWHLEYRDETPIADLGPLFAGTTPLTMEGAV